MNLSLVRRSRAAAGFSLVDLLVVVAFLGILTAVAIPALQAFATSMRLGAGVRDVERELQTARMKAVTSNRTLRVRFNCPDAGQFRMVELVGTSAVPDSVDVAADRCDAKEYPYPAADMNPLTRPNLDGPARALPVGVTFKTVETLEFWPDGSVHQQPETGGAWTVLPAGGVSLELAQGSNTRMITVNGLGKIQLQN